MRTLVIASAASAAAALLTSQLWIAGTWIAAAMTPVIVALVSEMLHRPTERIAKSFTSDRAALPAAGGAGRPARPHADPLPDRVPEEPGAGAGMALPPARGAGSEAPVRVYRSGGAAPRGTLAGGGGRSNGAAGPGPRAGDPGRRPGGARTGHAAPEDRIWSRLCHRGARVRDRRGRRDATRADRGRIGRQERPPHDVLPRRKQEQRQRARAAGAAGHRAGGGAAAARGAATAGAGAAGGAAGANRAGAGAQCRRRRPRRRRRRASRCRRRHRRRRLRSRRRKPTPRGGAESAVGLGAGPLAARTGTARRAAAVLRA